MPIISILVVLIVVGLLLWLIAQIPMDSTMHNIIRAVVIVVVILWLISLFFPIPFGNLRVR